ncbi:MAG: hypothetical protein WD577_07175 [Bacteroidales bacterium]
MTLYPMNGAKNIWKSRNLFWRRVLRSIAAGLVLFIFHVPQGCLKDFPETVVETVAEIFAETFLDSFPTEYVWKPLFAFPIGENEFGLKIPSGFDLQLLEIDTLTGYSRYVSMETIPLEGSIGFDFEQVLGKRDEINFAVLRLNAYNGFPIEVEIQAYIEDGSGEVLDSLFYPKMIIDRGDSGGGTIKQMAHTREEVFFDQERLDLLIQAKKITFRGELSNVRFFPQYTFRVQIGAVLGVIKDF